MSCGALAQRPWRGFIGETPVEGKPYIAGLFAWAHESDLAPGGLAFPRGLHAGNHLFSGERRASGRYGDARVLPERERRDVLRRVLVLALRRAEAPVRR